MGAKPSILPQGCPDYSRLKYNFHHQETKKNVNLLFFLDYELSIAGFVDVVVVDVLEAGTLHINAGGGDIERVIVAQVVPRSDPINGELAPPISRWKNESSQHQQNFHQTHDHNFITKLNNYS